MQFVGISPTSGHSRVGASEFHITHQMATQKDNKDKNNSRFLCGEQHYVK